MTSGGSSLRAESRLLDSAVRDAVGQAGVSGSGVNPSRRTESGVKRLRSVVVGGGTENPDLVSEANGRGQPLQPLKPPRLDMGQQGSKVPPGVAVALKAAAAAAEDVNNNLRSRAALKSSGGSVWDRLGNRSSERLGMKEIDAQVASRMDADNLELEDTWEEPQHGGLEGRITKRPRWRKLSERLGKVPREDEEMATDPDEIPGGFGYFQGKRSVENTLYDSVGMGMKVPADEVSEDDVCCGDVGIYTDGDGFFRYDDIKDQREDVSGKFQESGNILYRSGGIEREREAQGFHHGLISDFSGAVKFPNRLPNIHINSNARYLLSKDGDITLNGPHDLYSQLSKRGASLEKASGPSQAVDANDVLEMKKRLRQVQLEMTKLRAKQAEVSKEAQKVSSASSSAVMKPKSQEEIDLHSVCVTNIHFAATREKIAAHFSSCGDIVRVTVLTDPATGNPKGVAYVEFSSKEGVEKALNMNDSSLLSRTLKVVPKDAATTVVPPSVGRVNHVSSYASVRAPGKFMRGNPLNMRRPVSMARPFAGTANLQWKRETASTAGKPTTPKFGLGNGTSIPSTGRAGGLPSPTALMRDRYGRGPIRMTRSMSYIRPTPYQSVETARAAQ